jgi:AraC-like DNA-binding protein
MKPLLLDVKSLLRGSLFVKEIRTKKLNDQFHFHNAFELALILKGSGKRIVGDNIGYFSDRDLILMAPNLPHASYPNEDYCEGKSAIDAIVVYFHPDWLTENHLNSPDFTQLRELLNIAKRGVRILGKTQEKIIKHVLKLRESRGLGSIIIILQILELIYQSKEYESLASEGYSANYNQTDVQKIDEIYKYVMNNFTDKITLDDIASIANMTPPAFCKYFKSKTKKTFSSFVNEIRIGYACKLLMDDNLDISQICFRCGYNNLTNFNKNFKHFIKMIPTDYKARLKL